MSYVVAFGAKCGSFSKLPLFFVTECRFGPSTGGDGLPSRLAPVSMLKCRRIEREKL